MRISSAQAKKIADPQSFSVLFQLGREVAGIALVLDVAFRSEIFHQRTLDLGPIVTSARIDCSQSRRCGEHRATSYSHARRRCPERGRCLGLLFGRDRPALSDRAAAIVAAAAAAIVVAAAAAIVVAAATAAEAKPKQPKPNPNPQGGTAATASTASETTAASATAAATAAAPAATAAAPASDQLQAGPTQRGVFLIEDVEGRQTDVSDFLVADE